MKTPRLTTKQAARIAKYRAEGVNPCVLAQLAHYYRTGEAGEVLAAWLGRVAH